jgi:phosphoribosyl 1,2-cyclic phosphodiesterase
MELCALSSGSSGNCFYIGNSKNKEGILIDAGISSKRIVESLGQINVTPENIKGIFITHEHSDHTRGADVFARNFNIPIFATKKTCESSPLCSDSDLLNKISNHSSIKLAGIDIEAFSKSHKAADPVSFSAVKNGKTASVITDLGVCCNKVNSIVSDSDFLFLESNHDITMLENGPYPAFLKAWVKSDNGHLSNLQAGLCILEYGSKKLKNIVLSHLSQTNNTPEIAFNTMAHILKERKDLKPKIAVSFRNKTTDLFKL